jgi:hypothetical protein
VHIYLERERWHVRVMLGAVRTLGPAGRLGEEVGRELAALEDPSGAVGRGAAARPDCLGHATGTSSSSRPRRAADRPGAPVGQLLVRRLATWRAGHHYCFCCSTLVLLLTRRGSGAAFWFFPATLSPARRHFLYSLAFLQLLYCFS